MVAFGIITVAELALERRLHDRAVGWGAAVAPRSGASAGTSSAAWRPGPPDIHRDRLEGATSRLVVDALDHTTDRRHLLERAGYSIERWFFDMDRDLAEPVEAPRVPAGPDPRRLRLGPRRRGPAGPQRGLRHPLGFVTAQPRGVAAVVHRRPPLPARPQLRRARRRRGRGVRALPSLPRGGRAARLHVGDGSASSAPGRRGADAGSAPRSCAASSRRCRPTASDRAALNVDSRNATGALALYEREGFRRRHPEGRLRRAEI